MHVRAASVLPLEPQPVVSSPKDSGVEGLEELHDSMVEEPVGEGWVVDDSLGAGTPGVRVVGAYRKTYALRRSKYIRWRLRM